VSENVEPPRLRQRIIRGAGAQAVAHASRILVQFAMAGVLLPTWGLRLYGEWLILVGVAVFLGASDFGYITATVSDMNMAVGRGDREHALDVFRTVARGLAVVFSIVLLVTVIVVVVVPVVNILGLRRIDEASAAAILLMIAVQALLLIASLLLYGGFLCEGYYGEAVLIQALITMGEFGAACAVAVLGGGPVLATAALLAVRIAGTVAMYVAMRRRAPWLSLGRPAGRARVAKRLTRPALSMASIGWGTALNVQFMVVIVGVATGPASAAVFSTVRTLSRVILQVSGSIGQAVGPELAKAYAAGDDSLIHRLQRRLTQASIWSSAAMIAAFAIFGDALIRLWTHGHVHQGGVLLDLLLIGAGLEGAWLTAGSILFFTNRHQLIGLTYAIVSVAGLPVAYLLATAWGRNGAAMSLIAVGIVMLAQVLRLSLPAAHETLANWTGALLRPADVWQALMALRAQLFLIRDW
jgi:O-antigen/teichoic acid export membrane protein